MSPTSPRGCRAAAITVQFFNASKLACPTGALGCSSSSTIATLPLRARILLTSYHYSLPSRAPTLLYDAQKWKTFVITTLSWGPTFASECPSPTTTSASLGRSSLLPSTELLQGGPLCVVMTWACHHRCQKGRRSRVDDRCPSSSWTTSCRCACPSRPTCPRKGQFIPSRAWRGSP